MLQPSWCPCGRSRLTRVIYRYLFGGSNRVYNQTLNQVWVLSLPGFTWHQLASSPENTARARHSCVLAGKRQMVVVGGLDELGSNEASWGTPDPWPQSLGIFDLTANKWTGQYDSAAAAYDSPQAVKDWYSNGLVYSLCVLPQLTLADDGEQGSCDCSLVVCSRERYLY